MSGYRNIDGTKLVKEAQKEIDKTRHLRLERDKKVLDNRYKNKRKKKMSLTSKQRRMRSYYLKKHGDRLLRLQNIILNRDFVKFKPPVKDIDFIIRAHELKLFPTQMNILLDRYCQRKNKYDEDGNILCYPHNNKPIFEKSIFQHMKFNRFPSHGDFLDLKRTIKHQLEGGLDSFGKQCSKCHEVKDKDSFYFNKSKLDGYDNYCKECRKAYSNSTSVDK